MLQHELRFRRLWQCSACGRTVRTRGSVTSRSCHCSGAEHFMTVVDEPRIRLFDIAAFTTYDNEEDSTPTAAELVEELPEYERTPEMQAIAEGRTIEKPLRRGIGYLRAEVDSVEAVASSVEDVENPADSAPDSFGAGLELEPATSSEVVSDTDGDEPSDADSNEVRDDAPRGRRRNRRRSRRRRGRQSSGEESSESTNSLPSVSSEGGSVAEGESGSAVQSEASDSNEGQTTGRKRRRRRRRRGKRGNSGDSSSSGSSSGDTE